MEIKLSKEEGYYRLEIDYWVGVSLETAWGLIATNEGLTQWFPELHFEGNRLVFELDDFREEMEVLTYSLLSQVAYQWDKAQVSFKLLQEEAGCHLYFEEVIPQDFGNEFVDAGKDMIGWLVQNEVIKFLLEGEVIPSRDHLQSKWSKFLQAKL